MDGYWKNFSLPSTQCTQRIFFWILLIQTEIRLCICIPFFVWFRTKLKSIWFCIDRCMVNTIWFRFDLIRFRKNFSVCATNLLKASRLDWIRRLYLYINTYIYIYIYRYIYIETLSLQVAATEWGWKERQNVKEIPAAKCFGWQCLEPLCDAAEP